MFLGIRIKNRRKELGLTQKELGDAIGVSKISVCNWERNVKKPSSKNLIALSQVLNIDIEYLIGSDTYVVKSSDEKYGLMMADEEIAVVKELRRHHKLHSTLTENPKRALDRIDKLLF